MHNRRTSLLLSGMACTILQTACLPAPGVHEVLLIAPDGQYRLDGRQVAREQLEQILTVEQLRVRNLVIELRPAPSADMDAIGFSIQAIKSAHARLAFTRE